MHHPGEIVGSGVVSAYDTKFVKAGRKAWTLKILAN
jgi:hypothetical protein